MKKYIIKLTKREKENLSDIASKGKGSAKKILHARVLLKADAGSYGESWTDEKIVEAFDIGVRTVERIRERCVTEGLEAALTRREHKRYRPPKLDGKQEAYLVSIACSKAPEGRKRWTLRLLADKMVEMKYVDKLSHEGVRKTLKKMQLSLG